MQKTKAAETFVRVHTQGNFKNDKSGRKATIAQKKWRLSGSPRGSHAAFDVGEIPRSA
jgi:hypothetical protein